MPNTSNNQDKMCDFPSMTYLCVVLDSHDEDQQTYKVDIQYGCASQSKSHEQETKKCCKHRSRKHAHHGVGDEFSCYIRPSCNRRSHKISELRRRSKCTPRSAAVMSSEYETRNSQILCHSQRDCFNLIRDRNMSVPCSHSKQTCKSAVNHSNNYDDGHYSNSHCSYQNHSTFGDFGLSNHARTSAVNHSNSNDDGYCSDSYYSFPDHSRHQECEHLCIEKMRNKSNCCGHEATEDCKTWNRIDGSQHKEVYKYTHNYDYSKLGDDLQCNFEPTLSDESTVLPEYEWCDDSESACRTIRRNAIPGKSAVLPRHYFDNENALQKTYINELENLTLLKSILKKKNCSRSRRSGIRKKKSISFNRIATMITFRKNEIKLDRGNEQSVPTFNRYNYHSSIVRFN